MSNETTILLTHDDVQSANPVVVCVFASIGLLVSVVLFSVYVFFARAKGYRYGGIPIEKKKLWFCRTTSTLLVLLNTLAISYGVLIYRKTSLDYFGPMRVEKVAFNKYGACVKREDGYGCKHYNHFTAATVTLHWGYQWACGKDQSDVVCHTQKVDCMERVCTSERAKTQEACTVQAWESAMNETKQCVENIFKYAQDANYTRYVNATSPPAGDVDWPHFVAYGDCRTCRVDDYTYSTESLKGLRLTCWISFGITFALVAPYILVPVGKRLMRQNQKGSEQPRY